MTIRWITALLGTAPAEGLEVLGTFHLVDVRDLVDKAGNRTEAVREKIMSGVSYLKKGVKTIVCCDQGISRSNAVAAGILAVYENMNFTDAVRIVQNKTGEQEIKLEPLDAVRCAIEGKISGNVLTNTGNRTILVTGAQGFIGRATCVRLANNCTIISPTHTELDLEQGCTQLSLLVRQYSVDCIIHLANPRVYTSTIALGKTLAMLRNVLEVCVSSGIQLIYPSGWEIYSGYTGTMLVDEATPALPRGPYGETKYLAELMIKHWQKTTPICCSILRSSPVYGNTSNKPKFIFNFLEKAKDARPIITHRYINADPSLDLLHIDDFVDAVAKVCLQKYIGTLNIGTGILTSTQSVAEIIKAELRSKSEIKHTQIDAYTACIAMNSKKAAEVLNWRPTIGFNNGLKNIMNKINMGGDFGV